jgi:hypothetical protein
MKITEKLAALPKADEPYFSLEFFPPKTDMVSRHRLKLTPGHGESSIPTRQNGSV